MARKRRCTLGRRWGERCFAPCVQGAYARKRPVLPLFFLASTCVCVVEECVCGKSGTFNVGKLVRGGKQRLTAAERSKLRVDFLDSSGVGGVFGGIWWWRECFPGFFGRRKQWYRSPGVRSRGWRDGFWNLCELNIYDDDEIHSWCRTRGSPALRRWPPASRTSRGASNSAVERIARKTFSCENGSSRDKLFSRLAMQVLCAASQAVHPVSDDCTASDVHPAMLSPLPLGSFAVCKVTVIGSSEGLG